MNVKNTSGSGINLRRGGIKIYIPQGDSVIDNSEWIVTAISKLKNVEIVKAVVEDVLDDSGVVTEDNTVVNTSKKTSRRKKLKKEVKELKEEIEEDLEKLEDLEDVIEDILDDAESCDD